jgi:protocatechuate 3,4-dioxygenase beta subunit
MHRDRSAKLALAALAFAGVLAAALVFREQLFSTGTAREDGVTSSEERGADALGAASRARRIAAGRATDPDAFAGVIRGRVRDAAGAGIGGARIRALAQDRASDLPAEISTAAADSSGRFEIGVRGGLAFSVLAEADGYAPKSEPGVRAGDDVDLELAAELIVDGSVVDDHGSPVKGAAIAWLANVGGHEVERTATSDELGKWRLAGLPTNRDGFERLSANAAGFAPYLTWRVWDPSATGVVRFTVVLCRGGGVSGTVVDARTGAPIPGARVQLVRMAQWWGDLLPRRFRLVCEAVADADGVFRVSGVPAAEFLDGLAWVASAKGYARSVEQAPIVPDEKEVRMDLRLWAAGAIEGRVVDPKGQPLAGVRTAVFEWYSGYVPARSVVDGPEGVVTGPDGAFRLEAPSIAEGVRLSAKRESGQRGFAGGGPFAVAPGATTTVPDLVMELCPAAVLRVTDVQDRPIAGASIEVVAAHPELRSFHTGADGRALVSFERWVGESGQLSAPPKVSARGFVDQVLDPFVPEVSDPPEVRVTLSRATELWCHAIWADGADAAGITVGVAMGTVPIASIWPLRNEPRLTDEPVAGLLALAETDRTGRCRLPGIPAPPWHVAAWLEPRDEEPAVRVESVQDSSRVVLLQLAEPSPASRPAVEVVEAEVTVLDAASGKPVIDADVRLDRRSALPGAPGVYRCTVPRAVTRVSVYARDFVRGFDKKIDLAVAGNERFEVRLDPGVTIRGRAKLPADVSTSGAEISCTWSDRGRRAAPLLPSGEFEIRGVASGVPLEFLVQTAHRPKGAWNFVPMPFRPLEVPIGFREMTVDLGFVPATYVYLTLGGLPYSAGGDGWDMAMTGTVPEWNRNWRVTGVQFRAVLPMGSATARCEVRGYAPVVQSLDLKSDTSIETIQVR